MGAVATPSLTVGLLPRCSIEHQIARCINLPRMLDAKKISQLAMVFAIMNYKIGTLPFFQAPYFITASQ